MKIHRPVRASVHITVRDKSGRGSRTVTVHDTNIEAVHRLVLQTLERAEGSSTRHPPHGGGRAEACAVAVNA